MKVESAMHVGICCVSLDTAVSVIAHLMKCEGIGAVPVCKGDHLLGMVTDRDLALRALCKNADPGALKASDVMTRDVITCRADQDIEEAVRLMTEHLVRRLPVVDKKSRLIGMLSLGDVALHSSSQFCGDVLCSLSPFRTAMPSREGSFSRTIFHRH